MKTISISLNDKQAEALNHLCDIHGVEPGQVVDVLLLPYLFDLMDITVPISESAFKEFVWFMNECLGYSRTLGKSENEKG